MVCPVWKFFPPLTPFLGKYPNPFGFFKGPPKLKNFFGRNVEIVTLSIRGKPPPKGKV